MPLNITIDGRDVSKFVVLGSLETSQELTSEPDECSFELRIPGDNYAINPSIELASVGWQFGGVWTQSSTVARTGTFALRAANTAGTTVVCANSGRVPCQSGDTFYIRGWHRRGATFASSNADPARLRVNFYNAAGTVVAFAYVSCPSPTTAFLMAEGVVTCPNDPTIVSAGAAVATVGQTAGFFWFEDIFFTYDAGFVQYLKEVQVIEDAVTQFGGVIIDKDVSMTLEPHAGDYLIKVQCQDYQYHLTRFRLTKVYLDQTAEQIVTDIMADSRLTGLGFSLSTQVDDGPTLPVFTFKYETLLECIDRLARYVQFDWYIGYDKQLRFYDAVGATAPASAWALTSDLVEPYSLTAPVTGLSYKEDVSQLRNAIYVQGGEAVSVLVSNFFGCIYTDETDPRTGYIKRQVANNKSVVFDSFQIRIAFSLGTLPEFPTIGIDGIDDPAGFDCMVNYNEGTFWFNPPFWQDAGTSFTASEAIQVSYRYRYPIVTYAENPTSISTYGLFEHVSSERKLDTRENAELYAEADLTYYGKPLKELSYVTTRPGLILGTQQVVTLPRPGITGEYLITRIRTQYGEYLGSAALYQSANSYFKYYAIEAEGV